ncbi:chloroplast stem-loop binding protein of 41 kDa b, chloroplastic-like isoform X2 [Olea europaea var. sylvestris]|uniref:chloroplast stem-loop binding protein of 41 kDa b, chloroplastic-like isoform X2 n=1 Tax=Olea europaea var. sylvestris TaxID=158386 RepID=UPI000C1D84C6|nr:chloroplast stem-loop binding protein of 41 kDa b, chloroplastic-like isoform X2 [Olea europaea var. sylvestris]XP_022881154.1 chloroplast stem-loop binding protein of 41 kDa b, chloroplastic-like isoform X2 [Olea europaea var. sylvestris]
MQCRLQRVAGARDFAKKWSDSPLAIVDKRFHAHNVAEVDAVDPKSQHKGKLETESLLESQAVNYTSLRPVNIYGPVNYNLVEEWFFHHFKAGRPFPIPNSRMHHNLVM